MAADVGHSEAVSTAAKKSGYESNFNILWSRKQERPRVKHGHKVFTSYTCKILCFVLVSILL